MRQTCVVATPDGPFSITVEDGFVVATKWSTDPVGAPAEPADDTMAQAIAAVLAYYAGDFAPAMGVPTKQAGTPLQLATWRALRQVPAGTTVTYGQLAAIAGRPGAARAIGSAMARNAVPLFVPCHRVVRSDGSVGQFAFGTPLKQSLLRREAGKIGQATN